MIRRDWWSMSGGYCRSILPKATCPRVECRMWVRQVAVRALVILLLAFPTMALTGLAHASPNGKPEVLLFTTVDKQYLADSLEFWGNNVGVNGFMLAYVAEWYSTKNEVYSNLDVLKRINARGRPFGVDSNFIKVALGYGQLPVWTDDKAWAGVIDNFRNIADLAKLSGTKGIALDTEPYGTALFDSGAARFAPAGREVLRATVYQRGKEIMQALSAVFPDIEVIILPEGAFYAFNAGQEANASTYELWIDFFNGMASVKNKTGIVVAVEATYSALDKDTIKKIYDLSDSTMIAHVADQVFWRDKCSIALGMFPLGKAYDNKAARYSSDVFKNQLWEMARLSPKYVWIYDHGTAWFQLKAQDADRYTKGGRWIWEKRYQVLPTDPNIDEYYAVLRNYRKGF